MAQKLAVVMTDNGAVYWGEPVKGHEFCVTLQNTQQKENSIYPTNKGKLSIPLVRVLEIIELDDTFSSIKSVYEDVQKRFTDFQPNDKDDPSIADDWILKK